MKFQVMVPHDDNAAWEAKKHLNECGFKITNLFESAITVTATGETVMDLYALECEGNRLRYSIYKLLNGLTEIDNNGVKTLWRVVE